MAIIVKQVELARLDSDNREAHGVLYYADKVDSQGDFVTKAELKAAQERLATSGRMPFVVDVEHNRKVTQSAVTESYIAKSGDKMGAGNWIVTAKVDADTWPLVASGKLRAFSMQGTGKRTEIQKGNGKGKVTQLSNLEVEFISLVPRGANQTQFVAKSDAMPKWARDFQASLDDTLEAVDKRITKIYNIGDSDMRHSKVTKQSGDYDLEELRRRYIYFSDQLDQLDSSGAIRDEQFYRRRNTLMQDLVDLEDEIELASGSRLIPLNLVGRTRRGLLRIPANTLG